MLAVTWLLVVVLHVFIICCAPLEGPTAPIEDARSVLSTFIFTDIADFIYTKGANGMDKAVTLPTIALNNPSSLKLYL